MIASCIDCEEKKVGGGCQTGLAERQGEDIGVGEGTYGAKTGPVRVRKAA